MASRTSKASKTSASTSADVDAGGIFGGGTSQRASTGEVVVKQVALSVAGQVGTQLGKALVRGILGSMRR